MLIAPYLDECGFVPRVYLVDEDGYPLAKADGQRGFRTWEEAAEVSRFLVADLSTAKRTADLARFLG